ncbi:hypothetical protein DXV76_08585 [Rhodobacteraceae bacterium CCMM004]|nr:hypothetical protein DXV76_08585 [Rhodobacteraceae bacterium CCMM004]
MSAVTPGILSGVMGAGASVFLGGGWILALFAYVVCGALVTGLVIARGIREHAPVEAVANETAPIPLHKFPA